MKDKIKKYAKYTTNILGMICAILVGINGVQGIEIPHCSTIVQVVAVFQGVIGTWLIGGKLFSDNSK